MGQGELWRPFVGDSYLRRIEAGEINLTLGSLLRIANALGVAVGALLE